MFRKLGEVLTNKSCHEIYFGCVPPKNSVRPLEAHADNAENSLCFLLNYGTVPEFKGSVCDR